MTVAVSRRVRRASGRRIVAALVDQGVVALANAGNSLLGVVLLHTRHDAGALLLSISIGYLVVGLGRGFVAEAALAHLPRVPAAERARAARDALATSLSLATLVAVLLAVAWLVVPAGTPRPLIWIALVIPVVVAQDTARYLLMAAGRQTRTLRIDLVWVAVQGILVGVLVTRHSVSPATLVLAWGAGAGCGLGYFALGERLNPLRGKPKRWLSRTRHLAGWFSATSALGQIQVQLVAFGVAGTLGQSAFAGLRLAQLGILQPVQNLTTALTGLLVPPASRLAANGDAHRLRRQTRRTLAVTGGLGLVLVIAVAAAAGPVLRRLHDGDYIDVVPVSVPISLQAAVYLVQIPFAAAMRGMQQARGLFWRYLGFTALSLAALYLGARRAGLPGAAWGLAGAATVGLVLMVTQYATAIRTLTPRADPAESRGT